MNSEVQSVQSIASKLVIYDACTDQTIDTGLPFDPKPSYPDQQVSNKPYLLGQTFTIGALKYRLFDVDLFNLDKHVKIGGANVPKSFRGLWWMHGNPAPEVVVSLANAVLSKDQKLISFAYNGQDSYLFTPSPEGIATWSGFFAAKVQVRIRIPQGINLDAPKIGDKVFIDTGILQGLVIKADIQPTTFVKEGHWKREYPGGGCYNFRQIVDENGNKTSIYPLFVQEVQKQTQSHHGFNPKVLIQPRIVK